MDKLFQKLMALLHDFINTIGLDKSFFFQLALAVLFYFLSKKIFLEPYIENFEKRQELTKGRMTNSKKVEEKIEKQKLLYENKAQSVHSQFQKVFSEIQKKAQENYHKESLKAHKEQKEFITRERSVLNQALKTQEDQLKKDLPLLTQLLVERIKN